MKKILIVDDEPSIITLLKYNLEAAGYQVFTATDGRQALHTVQQTPVDFIILDITLPYIDGIEVCRKIRQLNLDTPILMLTARDTEYDKIIGLELGADDYMTKPFSPREVLARIKAILRRTEKAITQSNDILTLNNLTIDTQRYEVTLSGQLIDLTPKEFELLVFLAKNRGRILSREQLLSQVWDFDFTGETRIVDVHIGHLREKIETDTKKPQYIKTVRGFGYKFEVPTL